MSGLEELRRSLADVRADLDDAVPALRRARELLELSRRAIVDAQARADPWLPPQLDHALERIEAHTASLAGAAELLERYESAL